MDPSKDVALRAGHMIQEWRAINSTQNTACRSVAADARIPTADGLSNARVSQGIQLLRLAKTSGWLVEV
jgi:hypothetical protein